MTLGIKPSLDERVVNPLDVIEYIDASFSQQELPPPMSSLVLELAE